HIASDLLLEHPSVAAFHHLRSLPSFPTRRSSDLCRSPVVWPPLPHPLPISAAWRSCRWRRPPPFPSPRRCSSPCWRALGWGSDRYRKSTRLNSSHVSISYTVFCL